MTLWQLNKLATRFSAFVDSAHPRYWLVSRKLKELYRKNSGKRPYEHNPSTIQDDFRNGIEGVLRKLSEADDTKFVDHTDLEYRSAAVKLCHQGQANAVLAELAQLFLARGYPVQYLTASRHPLEFISYLKEKVVNNKSMDWTTVAGKVVVIDAYTPHFGFIDSIYWKATQSLKLDYAVMYVASAKTYAGLHTAASIAFNKIKNKTGGDVRHPALIIYEDCYALADLESTEQYRVFVRHVLPSERLWGGMFTVFAETSQADQDWKLLSSYVSATLEFGIENDAEQELLGKDK